MLDERRIGTCSVSLDSGVAPVLALVRARSIRATVVVVLIAAAASGISLAALDPVLTVFPAAFVIGWLNLAGSTVH